MAKPDALKRLGGGRWETKDGRFQIEPQSGTWVIVDTTQTNEFGLPLVRGPFGSLTAARDAIEDARESGPAESPLADRIEKARREEPTEPKSKTTSASKTKGGAEPRTDEEATGTEDEPTPRAKSGRAAARSTKVDEVPTPPPEPPPDPKWIRDLGPSDRRKAKELIERLEELEIDDAEQIARAQLTKRRPALAQLALERRLRAAAKSARTPRAAVAAAIEIIVAGKDDDLDVEWQLSDGQGRRIDGLDLGD